MQDPFYQQILDGLSGRLDPDVFEEAAADLLRDAFPSLVPIRGGSDFGMDAAIADGNGPAYSLTCTTSPDVIGNLRTSLSSYVESGGQRRKVVIATSQELTATKRKNLHAAAEELGFQVVQVFSRAAFAHRLYRNNDWCRRLLGLTGRPTALSVVPETTRPLVGEVSVGRDADLDWLRNLSTDGLLIGQPGSGKTYLLHLLAREGWGLFAVDNDLEALANAIRSQEPLVIIIDDAHTRVDLLTRLRLLREQLSAPYKIVASSWPGDAEQVAEALQLPSDRQRVLHLLTRDQIVEVVKTVGIQRPRRLVREIVDQAAGRPGLAVTLAILCLRGDTKKVVFGEILKRSLVGTLEQLVGRRVTQILAAFSIGGDAGLSLQDVAMGLELPAADIRTEVVRLAASGVVLEVDRKLSVCPATLRFLLVRDVFFSSTFAIPLGALLSKSENLAETANVLIGARAYGGAVSDDLLFDALERADSETAWAQCASLGPTEATEVLRRHPDLVISVARQALCSAPKVVLPLLLKEAVDDNRPLHTFTEHPLRLIDDWIKTRTEFGIDPIARRKHLLRAVTVWLKEGGSTRVGLCGLCYVLRLNEERNESDPGSGNTFTFYRSLLSIDEIVAVGTLWPAVRELLELHLGDDWEKPLEILHEWTYPETLVLGGGVPDEFSSAIAPIAQRILSEMASLAKDRPGILHRLQQYAKELENPLPVEIPREFAILFPNRTSDDWREANQRHVDDVQHLASQWKDDAPECIAERIAAYDREARQANISWPSGTTMACRMLAASVSSSLGWFRALRDRSAHPDLLEPFLNRAVLNCESGWEKAIRECLGDRNQRWLGVTQALMQDSCAELVSEAMILLEDCGRIVETICLRGQVPIKNLAKLLQHPAVDISTAAAIGEWLADPQHSVRPELDADWRVAVLRADTINHWIVEVLKSDAVLAEDWLMRHLQTSDPILPSTDEYEKITTLLDQAARRRLISSIPVTYRMQGLATSLVGDDRDLYREMLSNPRLKPYHLVPLQGMSAVSWRVFAISALDAGYSPADIAQSVHGGMSSWSGPASARWQNWIDRFRLLSDADDERMRQVATVGIHHAEQNRDAALIQERNEAVFGE